MIEKGRDGERVVPQLMNIKPMNRENLQELFDRFDYIKNHNEITVLGYYEKQRDVSANKFNPNYRFLHIHHDIGNEVQEVPTAKITVKIPSASRHTKTGENFLTTIPLFTTDDGVTAVRELDKEVEDGAKKYIVCKGAVQNFSIAPKMSTPSAMTNYMKTWMSMFVGRYDENLAIKILRILRLAPDKDGLPLPMLNVWIHELADGTELAQSLADSNQLVGVNRASITGLVYMPPSLRLDNDGSTGIIHFKVRVERHDIEGQTVPIAQYSKNGYDIINVIYSTKDAETDFKRLHQGYPVSVVGSLENYKFTRRVLVNDIEKQQLSQLLNVRVYDDAIQEIVHFVERENIRESVPTFNILAQEVRTDYENW